MRIGSARLTTRYSKQRVVDGIEGVRAPNLGPIGAQRPRLAITERLLAVGRLLHPRWLETHKPISADLGVKSHEFLSCPPPPR